MNVIHIFLSICILVNIELFQRDRLLFDGVSLDGWQIINFEGHGRISIIDSSIIIYRGESISGIRWMGDFPKTNYEINLDAKLIEGSDFFCGLTFPIEEFFLTLILGGWGGGVVGLSCIDGFDAENNFTAINMHFETNIWYAIKLIVTDNKIEVWIGNDKIIDFLIDNHYLSLRWEVESSVPFGITTYRTTGALRNITLNEINN